MRIGQNPLKTNISTLGHKNHRVIIPFWIPDTSHQYFEHQPMVLDLCLESLTSTINPEFTAITLVNNSSCQEATMIAKKYLDKGAIDKYVMLNQNRGKLDAVLSEARASTEDFITISDADFLFFPGWEEGIAKIMKQFPAAGMVTPFPAAHLAYFYNSNLIYTPLKSGKVINDNDIDLFERGIGHDPRKGLYSSRGFRKTKAWRDCHYYVENRGVKAIAGAVHALATYRKQVVRGFNNARVEHVFKNGYEHEFIDFAPENEGFVRLSTPVTLAYHLGNSMPSEIITLYREQIGEEKVIQIPDWGAPLKKRGIMKTLSPATRLLFRILRKARII